MLRRRVKLSIVLLAATAAMLAGACRRGEVKPDSPETSAGLSSGYTCCNFHYANDWINDGNYAELPMIPAGTPIKLNQIERYIAYVEIDGKPFRLGLDYGRTLETTEQWLNKLVVPDDPKARLATYAPAVRRAIQNGQIMHGMTKEQVIMSLGYPETDQNPRLDVPFWRYWRSSFGEYKVHWNSAERVSEISGHAETVALMTAPGHAAAAPAPATALPPGTPSGTKKSENTKKGVKNDAKSKQGN
jgi:hypothetical protein